MKKNEIVYNYLISYIQTQRMVGNKLPSEVALANRLDVSRVTVRKALDHLKKEQYVYSIKGSGNYFYPTRSSHRPASEKPQKICILMQGNDYNANRDILTYLFEETKNDNFIFEVFQTNNTYQEEEKCIKSCLNGYFAFIVDGVKSNLRNPLLPYYKLLEKKGIPVIFYNNYYRELNHTKVIVDELYSAELLIERLLAGQTSSGIGGIFLIDQGQAMEKYNSLLTVMESKKIRYEENLYLLSLSHEFNNTRQNYKKKLVSFFKKTKSMKCCICCNEQLYSCVDELRNEGLIRNDMILACFDSSELSADDKDLCTIHPAKEMGHRIALILNEIKANGRIQHANYKFTAEINKTD